ncbi:unnamed protein product [Gordionus sp. m RMFG-2023]
MMADAQMSDIVKMIEFPNIIKSNESPLFSVSSPKISLYDVGNNFQAEGKSYRLINYDELNITNRAIIMSCGDNLMNLEIKIHINPRFHKKSIKKLISVTWFTNINVSSDKYELRKTKKEDIYTTKLASNLNVTQIKIIKLKCPAKINNSQKSLNEPCITRKTNLLVPLSALSKDIIFNCLALSGEAEEKILKGNNNNVKYAARKSDFLKNVLRTKRDIKMGIAPLIRRVVRQITTHSSIMINHKNSLEPGYIRGDMQPEEYEDANYNEISKMPNNSDIVNQPFYPPVGDFSDQENKTHHSGEILPKRSRIAVYAASTGAALAMMLGTSYLLSLTKCCDLKLKLGLGGKNKKDKNKKENKDNKKIKEEDSIPQNNLMTPKRELIVKSVKGQSVFDSNAKTIPTRNKSFTTAEKSNVNHAKSSMPNIWSILGRHKKTEKVDGSKDNKSATNLEDTDEEGDFPKIKYTTMVNSNNLKVPVQVVTFPSGKVKVYESDRDKMDVKPAAPVPPSRRNSKNEILSKCNDAVNSVRHWLNSVENKNSDFNSNKRPDEYSLATPDVQNKYIGNRDNLNNMIKNLKNEDKISKINFSTPSNATLLSVHEDYRNRPDAETYDIPLNGHDSFNNDSKNKEFAHVNHDNSTRKPINLEPMKGKELNGNLPSLQQSTNIKRPYSPQIIYV